jgi:hypothetical protein
MRVGRNALHRCRHLARARRKAVPVCVTCCVASKRSWTGPRSLGVGSNLFAGLEQLPAGAGQLMGVRRYPVQDFLQFVHEYIEPAAHLPQFVVPKCPRCRQRVVTSP